MDKVKDFAGNMGEGGGKLQDIVKDIQFPVGKEQLVSQLQQRGAPKQLVDKISGLDTQKFGSHKDLMSEVGGLF
jgi:hypothetical protein